MKKFPRKVKVICIAAGSVLAVICCAKVKKRKKFASVEYVEPWEVFW